MLETNRNDFFYGMKRFFDIGCQPKGQKGLVSPDLLKEINKEANRQVKFLDVVRYENELSDDEVAKFELVPLKNLKCIGA